MKCFCCLRRQVRRRAPMSRSYYRRGIWRIILQRASWQRRTLSSLPKDGDAVSATILQMTPRLLGSSLPATARQPPDGALQAGANITALALASAFLAFGLTLVWATISSEVARTLTQRP